MIAVGYRQIHTSNGQLVALWLSIICWTLTAAALGVVEWRMWRVADTSVITSGVASVGVWKTCFHSHVLVSPEFRIMFCRSMASAGFVPPPEIRLAQVLLPLALLAGLGGNAAAVYALRNVYFGLLEGRARAFVCAGALCVLSAVLSLAPLAWNLRAVLANSTVTFPPEFHMPPAPESQSAGSGILVGLAAGMLTLVSGLVFLSYRPPPSPPVGHAPRPGPAPSHRRQVAARRETLNRVGKGTNNPAFEFNECL